MEQADKQQAVCICIWDLRRFPLFVLALGRQGGDREVDDGPTTTRAGGGRPRF